VKLFLASAWPQPLTIGKIRQPRVSHLGMDSHPFIVLGRLFMEKVINSTPGCGSFHDFEISLRQPIET
jgi:hypothetical protein